jgi:hypothetical protein
MYDMIYSIIYNDNVFIYSHIHMTTKQTPEEISKAMTS